MVLFCLVFAIYLCFVVATGKGLTSSRLWCLTVRCHFPIGILGQMWYLIVSIPDLCTLSYFDTNATCSDFGQKCLQLPGMLTLIHCDITSYPSGKGNVTVLNIIRYHETT